MLKFTTRRMLSYTKAVRNSLTPLGRKIEANEVRKYHNAGTLNAKNYHHWLGF